MTKQNIIKNIIVAGTLTLTACKQASMSSVEYNAQLGANVFGGNTIIGSTNMDADLGAPNSDTGVGNGNINDPGPPSSSNDNVDITQLTPNDSNYKWIPFPWNKQHADYLKWNKFTYDSINKNGKILVTKRPQDIKDFCGNFDKLNEEGKKMFWIGLLSAMAKFESAYKPSMTFTEDFSDSTGDNVISTGLLQLSYESGKAYGCNIKSTNDLKKADLNLDCGVRILSRWLSRDGVISDNDGGWRGGARYWAVLRKSSTLSQIQNMTQKLEVCR